MNTELLLDHTPPIQQEGLGRDEIGLKETWYNLDGQSKEWDIENSNMSYNKNFAELLNNKTINTSSFIDSIPLIAHSNLIIKT